MSGQPTNRGVFRTLIDNSFLLIAGAVAALLWANLAHQRGSTSYQDFVQFDVRTLWGRNTSDGQHGADHDDGQHAEDHNDAETEDADSGAAEHGTSAHDAEAGDQEAHGDHESHHQWYHLGFIINDVLMALFFAIAAKEVWESMLPGGALSNPRKAATPLMATLGGIVGPALIYFGGAYFSGPEVFEQLGRGWAVPCATDIAFSYLVARIIFGAGHPAIAFLLLLAIADDAAGLLILAVFYPSAPDRAGLAGVDRRGHRVSRRFGKASRAQPLVLSLGARNHQLVFVLPGQHPPRARLGTDHSADAARSDRFGHLCAGKNCSGTTR